MLSRSGRDEGEPGVRPARHRVQRKDRVLARRHDRFGTAREGLTVEVGRIPGRAGGRIATAADRLGDEAAAADRGELAAEQVLEDVGQVDPEVEPDRALLPEVAPRGEHDPVVATDERRRRQMELTEHPGRNDRAREAVGRIRADCSSTARMAPPLAAASVMTRQPAP